MIPSGLASAIGLIIGFQATIFLRGLIPLWAAILTGVAIFGLGIWLDFRHGGIEVG